MVDGPASKLCNLNGWPHATRVPMALPNDDGGGGGGEFGFGPAMPMFARTSR